jgi:hypothetical protein
VHGYPEALQSAGVTVSTAEPVSLLPPDPPTKHSENVLHCTNNVHIGKNPAQMCQQLDFGNHFLFVSQS